MLPLYTKAFLGYNYSMTHKCRQGVILSAGIGSRLEKHGEDMPKSLFRFNNKSLLVRNVELMFSMGIEQVIVVGGYKIDMICDELKYFKNVLIVENKEYKDTQTCYSMSLAYDFIDECFIQTEGDFVFEKRAMKELLRSSGNSMVHSEYRNTHSVSVPQFEGGRLINFNRDLKYRNGIQQPPNFTGPSHFTKDMLKDMKYYDQLNNNSLLYEEAVALAVSKENIPLSMLYIPETRYWDLNVEEDFENVSSLINTLDEEVLRTN
jgi:choline kinase